MDKELTRHPGESSVAPTDTLPSHAGTAIISEHRRDELSGRTLPHTEGLFMLCCRRKSGFRSTIAIVVAWILVAVTGCTGNGSSPDSQGQPKNILLVSYAGAASWLDGLDQFEKTEQLRDWARIGLAAQLELDTAHLRTAAYDTLPVRDQGFADLSRQATGPGRALIDGNGVLHVLIPHGNPRNSRTIGLLLDQHRTDAGADPQQVQLHEYEDFPGAHTIKVVNGSPTPTADVRAGHGYVTARIDDTKGLTDFLARTHALSWLTVRGSEIHASGWSWPDLPNQVLDIEDISVLQRGYPNPPSQGRPGFSLDPGPKPTVDDLRAVLPNLSPELAGRIAANNTTGALTDLIDRALHQGVPEAELTAAGLPVDRGQLWGVYWALAGNPGYSQARYDGGLQGTKVAMTLFYADYVAKNWISGVGTGVPSQAVEGFVPDPDAVTPWSHCPGPNDSKSESGRLWFGQNESGFAFHENDISIGERATRLFARSNGAAGVEVEPSFAFGRGLRWWDEHYQAIADYEPEYERLEQIMRWSAALEWLVTKKNTRLQLDGVAIRSDLRFQDWYAQTNTLRERAPIDFVTPPSASNEAVRSKPSKSFAHCGGSRIVGGVSLADLVGRMGKETYRADLPAPVSRAGLFDKGSTFDPAAGTGRIKQVSIDDAGKVVDSREHTFSTTDGRSAVDVAANGRRVSPFGGLKVWRAETAPRQLRLELSAEQGRITQDLTFQGQELGRLTVRKDVDNVVTVQWRSGFMDRVRLALESIQKRRGPQPSDGAIPAGDTVLLRYRDAAGTDLYRVANPDAPWLSVEGLRPPGNDLAFRAGYPDPVTGEPTFVLGSLRDLPPPARGPPGWLEVTPAAPDRPATAKPADSATPDGVSVTTPDGKSATVYGKGDRLFVRTDDPVLGLSGTVEGAALLRDFPRVEEAMRSAAAAKDGLLHGVPLGRDGVALVGDGRVILLNIDHPLAAPVQRAAAANLTQPLIRVKGDHAARVVTVEGTDFGTSLAGPMRLGTALNRIHSADETAIYVREGMRSTHVTENSPIPVNALFREDNVTFLEIPLGRLSEAEATAIVSQPEIIRARGGDWLRVAGVSFIGGGIVGGGGNGGVNGGTGPPQTTSVSPTPSPDGSAGPAWPRGRIILICPDRDEAPSGCGQ